MSKPVWVLSGQVSLRLSLIIGEETLIMSRLMTKPTKWSVRPSKTQISMGIRPVWLGSSLSAWIKPQVESLATHWAPCEDSDQTGWSDWADAQADLSLRWAQSHFAGFITKWFICRISYLSLTDLSQNTKEFLMKLINALHDQFNSLHLVENIYLLNIFIKQHKALLA